MTEEQQNKLWWQLRDRFAKFFQEVRDFNFSADPVIAKAQLDKIIAEYENLKDGKDSYLN